MTLFQRSCRTILEASFLLLIFSLGFTQPNVTIAGMPMPVTDFLFPAVAVMFLISNVSGAISLRFDRIFLLFALYAGAMAISVVWSQDPRASSIKLLGEGYLIGLAFVTANVVRSPKFANRVIVAWLLASAIVSLLSIICVASFYAGYSNFITDLALHHYGSLPRGNFPRIQGTFLYPAMLCNYLTVSALLLLVWRSTERMGRALFLFLAAILGATILFTVTPGIGGVLLGLGLWYSYYFAGKPRTSLAKLSFSAGCLAAAAFFVVSSVTFIADPTSPYHFVPQRPLTWQSAFQTFLDHPIVGKGLGMPVAEVYFRPPAGGFQLLTDAHNVFISVAAQAGIISLTPLVLICIAVIKRSFTRLSTLSEFYELRIALGIAFISTFVYQGLLGSFEDCRHLWVLIGLVIAISDLDKGDG